MMILYSRIFPSSCVFGLCSSLQVSCYLLVKFILFWGIKWPPSPHPVQWCLSAVRSVPPAVAPAAVAPAETEDNINLVNTGSWNISTVASALVRIFYFIFCIQYSYSSNTVLDFLLPRSEPGDCPDGVGIFRPPQLGWRDWAGLCLQYPGVLQAGLCWHSPPRLQHQQFLDEIFPFRAARTKWETGPAAEAGIYLITSNWSSSKV